MLLYDMTSILQLKNLKNWVRKISETKTYRNAVCLVMGTHFDNTNDKDREFWQETLFYLKEDWKCEICSDWKTCTHIIFAEVSLITGTNLEQAIENLCEFLIKETPGFLNQIKERVSYGPNGRPMSQSLD